MDRYIDRCDQVEARWRASAKTNWPARQRAKQRIEAHALAALRAEGLLPEAEDEVRGITDGREWWGRRLAAIRRVGAIRNVSDHLRVIVRWTLEVQPELEPEAEGLLYRPLMPAHWVALRARLVAELRAEQHALAKEWGDSAPEAGRAGGLVELDLQESDLGEVGA